MPSSAGNNVSAAVTTTRTPVTVTAAVPYRYDIPIEHRPSREITTVPPANNTARPDVASASATASCGCLPAASAAR